MARAEAGREMTRVFLALIAYAGLVVLFYLGWEMML